MKISNRKCNNHYDLKALDVYLHYIKEENKSLTRTTSGDRTNLISHCFTKYQWNADCFMKVNKNGFHSNALFTSEYQNTWTWEMCIIK